MILNYLQLLYKSLLFSFWNDYAIIQAMYLQEILNDDTTLPGPLVDCSRLRLNHSEIKATSLDAR